MRDVKHKVIRTEQCPECATNGHDLEDCNNLAVYEDGSVNCFACPYNISNNEVKNGKSDTPKIVHDEDLLPGVPKAMPDRSISLETAEKFNVRQQGHLRIFPIYENGVVARQKIKNIKNKKKQWHVGNTECMTLFGQGSGACNPTDRISITVTEGEEDAMAFFQATGYPAVSGSIGADGLIKELTANLEWLAQWRHVNLCLDNDDVGKAALEQCCKIFEPGKVRIMSLPLKDCNDMLREGRCDELKKCMYNAAIFKPKTLVTAAEIKAKVLVRPAFGVSWGWKSMDKATYGLLFNSVYLLAGPTSVGKTEFLREILSHLIEQKVSTGIYNLEQLPADTIRRFVGAMLNKRIHIPTEDDWDEELIGNYIDKLGETITLYDTESGTLSIEQVIINIRYSNVCYGTKFFVIDNLTMLASNPTIGGKATSEIPFMQHCVSQFAKLAREIGVAIFVIAHLNTDRISFTAKMGEKAEIKDGMRWESGRMASLENVYGGNKISNLVDYVIVLGRNRTSEDKNVRAITKVKFLKTRLDSQYEGFMFRVKYNYDTGRLPEYFGEECLT